MVHNLHFRSDFLGVQGLDGPFFRPSSAYVPDFCEQLRGTVRISKESELETDILKTSLINITQDSRTQDQEWFYLVI